MPAETSAFFSFSGAYEVTGRSGNGQGGETAGASVQTVARYADKDLLLSGWLEGEDVLAGRSAVVQLSVGTGKVVLLGFRVQHRGQSLATFRLLFNALLAGR
jgi:hypothetical protein